MIVEGEARKAEHRIPRRTEFPRTKKRWRGRDEQGEEETRERRGRDDEGYSRVSSFSFPSRQFSQLFHACRTKIPEIVRHVALLPRENIFSKFSPLLRRGVHTSIIEFSFYLSEVNGEGKYCD